MTKHAVNSYYIKKFKSKLRRFNYTIWKKKQTPRGILLNTSFVRTYTVFQIVNDVKDVFKIFEKSNLDALIINNDLYIKPNF